MPKLTPEVLARLAHLEAIVSSDWQQQHAEYEPLNIIANLDGGYGDDGTQVRYDNVCVVDEDLSPDLAGATAELIPLMRNHFKELLCAAERYRKLKAWLLDRGSADVYADEFSNSAPNFDTLVDKLPNSTK